MNKAKAKKLNLSPEQRMDFLCRVSRINVYSHLQPLRFNPYNAEIFLYKPWRPTIFFNLKSSKMSSLALSDSFEYLCYGSTAIINLLILSVLGPHLSESDVCRRQILTYNYIPRTERVKRRITTKLSLKIFLM